MKNRVILLLLLVFIVSIAFASGDNEAKESKKGADTIVFAVDSTWPPMEFIDIDSGDIIGFSIDLVEAIAKEEGLNVEFKTIAWDGIFTGLQTGEYDAIISSVTITEERKKTMTFSDPYFNAGQILAIRTEDAGVISSLKDLVGKEVGAQIGTSGASEVQKVDGVILKTYDALGPAVAELAFGTIDGIVADTPLVAEYLLRSTKYEGTFITAGDVMTSEEYGMVFRKTGSEALVEKINNGLVTIKNNGVYDSIYNEWIK